MSHSDFVRATARAFNEVQVTLSSLVTLMNTLLASHAVVATAPAASASTAAPVPSSATDQVHRLPPGVKAPTPEPFDAKDKRLVPAWLSVTESALRLAGHAMDSGTIHYVSAFLKGRAADWFKLKRAAAPDNLKASGGFTSWSDFASVFEKELGDAKPRDKARERLTALRQVTSVLSYGEKFVDAISKLPDMFWEDIRFFYLRGLKPEIQQMMAGKYDDTARWDDLHALAMQCDSIRAPGFPCSDNASRLTFASRNHATPMDLGNMQSSSSRSQSPSRPNLRPSSPHRPSSTAHKLLPLTDAEREELRRKGACFRCRQVGHTSHNCPKYKTPSRTVSPARSISSSPKN